MERSNFRARWGIPLWLALMGSGRGSGSKIETILDQGFAHQVYRAKYAWMELLAYRFVRRRPNKILAADSYQLVKMIQDRHGSNSHFYDRIPSADLSIGYLTVDNRLEVVRATAESSQYNVDAAVAESARYRKEKLLILAKKKKQPEPEIREAMILSWETSALLKVREREAKSSEYTAKKEAKLEKWRLQNEEWNAGWEAKHQKRSDAAKQSWLRRQQNGSPAEHGGNDRAVGSDNVPCVEQHA